MKLCRCTDFRWLRTFIRIQHLARAAGEREPRAHDAVREAPGAVLVLRALELEELHGLRGIVAAVGLAIAGIDLRPQALPFHSLEVVFPVVELAVDPLRAPCVQVRIEADIVAQRPPHRDRRIQGARVEARDHAARTPELDVIGVVLGLLRPTLVRPGPPGRDAVVEADSAPSLGQRPLSHAVVSADPPLTVDLHDPAQLAVGCGEEVMGRRLDREGDPEILVPALVLPDVELGLSQRTLERREEVGDRLGVVPDMGAASLALCLVVVASLPSPEAAVRLAQDSRRLQDAQVGRRCLDRLRRKRRVEKAAREALGAAAQVEKYCSAQWAVRASMLANFPPYQGW